MVQKLRHERGALFDDTPRGILEALLIAGGITITLSAAPALLLALGAIGYALKGDDKARRRRLERYGSYLKTRKYVSIQNISGNRARVSLTPLGRKRAMGARARRMLSGAVDRPEKWDGKWRMILFDIAAEERTKRNAFRAFIRRIGAIMLQKSVWIHPFDCSQHIQLLRDHFSLSNKELRLILADRIGDDGNFRRHFKLSLS